jgi:hypothetical protein
VQASKATAALVTHIILRSEATKNLSGPKDSGAERFFASFRMTHGASFSATSEDCPAVLPNNPEPVYIARTAINNLMEDRP